jgi:ribosomal protein S18 acetylase RimI-like enzyme
MRINAGRSEPLPWLRDLDRAAFGADLDALMNVYEKAMGVAAVQLPGRRSIMEAHAANPGFRAIAVTAPPGTAPPGTAPPGTAPPGTAPPGTRPPGTAHDTGPGSGDAAIIAFAYGFHGDSGQWWHDLVRAALMIQSGSAAVTRWLDDSFEVAELHVHPGYQRRGIGRQLLFRLTGDRTERTALLSTMDTNSPARRLYRSAGFTDLLTDYRFAGAPVPYAVMGAALPLLRARS